MNIEATNLRKGNIIDYKKKLYRVVTTEHVKQGRGIATLKAELKQLDDGTKLNLALRPAEGVELVHLDEKKCQFLFQENNDFTFMDNQSFDQIIVNKELIGDEAPFLQENMIVSIALYNETPISVTLPEKVTLEVIEADAVIKGQTVSSSYKPALLANNVRIMVPPFINVGERIVVRVSDASYVEREKKG